MCCTTISPETRTLVRNQIRTQDKHGTTSNPGPGKPPCSKPARGEGACSSSGNRPGSSWSTTLGPALRADGPAVGRRRDDQRPLNGPDGSMSDGRWATKQYRANVRSVPSTIVHRSISRIANGKSDAKTKGLDWNPNREAPSGEGTPMSARASGREIRVGLVVVVALAALMGLLAMAGGGPGFLADRRQIDVDFKNGQGIRPGQPGPDRRSRVGPGRGRHARRGRGVAPRPGPAIGPGRPRREAPRRTRGSPSSRASPGQTRVNILSIGQSHMSPSNRARCSWASRPACSTRSSNRSGSGRSSGATSAT